jgi:hypothetical protein
VAFLGAVQLWDISRRYVWPEQAFVRYIRKTLGDCVGFLHPRFLFVYYTSDLIGLGWSGFDSQIHSIRRGGGGAPGLQYDSRLNIYYK